MKEHLESYWLSVKNATPDGAREYSQVTPTKDPEKYPTVYDFLTTVIRAASEAAAAGDEAAYRHWLTGHQEVMIKLHEKRVKELLEPYGEQDEGLIFDFIKEKGWDWFKFYDRCLVMDYTMNEGGAEYPMAWIPRYLPKFKQYWEGGGYLCFDADELKFIWGLKDRSIVDRMVETKAKTRGLKLSAVRGTELFWRSARGFNEASAPDERDHVRDWALPLWS